jgi:RNA polymerase-binding transcription factor DksA
MDDSGRDQDADAALLDRVGRELDAVETALDRLDDAEAARCEECGASFEVEELLSDPRRTCCDRHGSGPDPGGGSSSGVGWS